MWIWIQQLKFIQIRNRYPVVNNCWLEFVGNPHLMHSLVASLPWQGEFCPAEPKGISIIAA